DAETQSVVHRRDEDGGDQESAEAAGTQAQVPPVEVARDDGGDPQRPQRPEGCVSLQQPFRKVAGPRLLVSNRTDPAPFLSHVRTSSSRMTPGHEPQVV